MRKNIVALYKAHNISKKPGDNLSIDKIYTIIFIIFNIINIIKSKNIENLATSDISIFFIQHIFIYIINIISIFTMIYTISIEEIHKYISMLYLPITSNEFFLFLNLLKIKRIIILILMSIAFFLMSTIKLHLSLYIFFKITLLLIALTLIVYFLINIIINLIVIILPSVLFKAILKCINFISCLLMGLLNSSIVELSNEYFAKYLLSLLININLVILLLFLSLIIFSLYYINNSLIKYIFDKVIITYQDSQKTSRHISIDSIKGTSNFSAYIKNELVLFKIGTFNYLNSFSTLIMLASMIGVLLGLYYQNNFINLDLFIFALINFIALFSDTALLKYNINSLYSLDEYFTWTKYTCVDVSIYFKTKLILKGILNTINYIILICLLYVIMYLLGYKSYVLLYSCICYLNIWIIAYFNNNLDFKYSHIDNKSALGVLFNTAQKTFCFALSKIVIVIFQLIIFKFIFNSVAITILTSYLVILLTIYLDLGKFEKL